MKICTGCNINKILNEFSKNKKSYDKLQSYCKECNHTNYLMNKEYKLKYQNDYYKTNTKNRLEYATKRRESHSDYIAEYGKQYRLNNSEYFKDYNHEYYLNNSEKFNEYNKKWRQINSAKYLAICAKARIFREKRIPKWLSNTQFNEIKEYYILANELQWLSNEQLQVDHIVPLKGKNVSGLHVPWNLQILPSSENQSKHNKFDGTYNNLNWKKFF